MTFARALVAAILLLQASVAYAAVAFDVVGTVQHSGSATSVPSSALAGYGAAHHSAGLRLHGSLKGETTWEKSSARGAACRT
jgi:hypothetical protein